jgi:hypothetical protein
MRAGSMPASSPLIRRTVWWASSRAGEPGSAERGTIEATTMSAVVVWASWRPKAMASSERAVASTPISMVVT